MMALDQLDVLETRIRDLVKLVQQLKRKNASLEEEIKAARQKLATEEDLNRRWENERMDIQTRIEKVIGDIELLEYEDDPKEVPLN